MDKNSLTLCEEQVMKCIWESEEELTLPDIVTAVNYRFRKDWKPQTVSTFLARLVRKDYLNMYRKGRTFYYTPLVQKEDYSADKIEECVTMWSGDDASALLCALNERRNLRAEEISQIRALLDELD